jgi:hypothetical protein
MRQQNITRLIDVKLRPHNDTLRIAALEVCISTAISLYGASGHEDHNFYVTRDCEPCSVTCILRVEVSEYDDNV